MYIFLDESGTFHHGKGSTSSVSVAALLIRDNATLKRMTRTLKAGYQRKTPKKMRTLNEIRCSKAPDTLRRYILTRLVSLEDLDSKRVVMTTMAVRQEDFKPRELFVPTMVYPLLAIHAVIMALKGVPDPPSEIIARFDHFLPKAYRPAVLASVRDQAHKAYGDKVRVDADFASSDALPGLQMVDYFAWAARRFRDGDAQWMDLYAESTGGRLHVRAGEISGNVRRVKQKKPHGGDA